MNDITKRLECAGDNYDLILSGKGITIEPSLLREALSEILAMQDRLKEIMQIANIAPDDDRFGSLAVRMGQIWMLARGR